MTQPLAALDAAELTQWLMRVTQTIDRSLREPARSEAAASLRDGLDPRARLNLPVLAQLALLADCLHVAQLAILADGVAEPDELDRVAGLVGVAAAKYFVALPAYVAFDDGVTAPGDIARFLAAHRDDPGPFGYARSAELHGLALVRLVERSSRNPAPLQDHERMLIRVMETVFAGRTTPVEHAARRKLRALFELPGADTIDPRAAAFCRSDGPEVFSSIAHGSQFHERDPFDVETIHAEARQVFHHKLERATTPEQAQRGPGSMLLVLGESGAGKTHLLRALRAQVHGRRLGYVGYLQLTADLDDPTRHVLRSLIDSLEAPYDAPSLVESGLMYLSDGLLEGGDALTPDDIAQLRTADLAPADLENLVGRLVDRIVRSERLGRLEVDLVGALLLLQRRDPALQRRIVRFLRCDPLTHYDRQLLGGIAPRDRAEDPLRTIQQLGTIMYELQLAALVVVVDQIEEMVPGGHEVARLQHALDALRAIADAVPSSIIVLSCLEDVYDAVKGKLSRSLRDRLGDELRIQSRREPDEIEHMLTRRLEHLYGYFDVAWRDDDPLYPFQPAQIARVAHYRTRDCLGKFREYHSACIAAHALVAVERARSAGDPVPPEPPPPPPPADLERLWSETLSSAVAPDDDTQILALVADALRGAAIERDLEIDVRSAELAVLPHLIVEGKAVPRRIVAVCNNPPQRGSFGAQLANLRVVASKASAIAIALRNGDFKFQPRTKMAQYVGAHIEARGLAVPLAEAQLRVAAAGQAMSTASPAGYLAWRGVRQPLGEIPFVRQILELDRDHAAPGEPAPPPAPADPPPAQAAGGPARSSGSSNTAGEAPAPPGRPASEPGATGANKHDSGPVPAPASAVRLGVVDSLRAEPILLALEDIKTHMAFLGSTGSGKTTAALSVVEQLLERDVSVVLVDRKGDLARYASQPWWNDASVTAAERDRKRALRDRLDIALFTPGNSHGRPLRLPLVPAMADLKSQEREQLARYAADGLAAMMSYGKTSAHKAKASILQCAIMVHGDERDITLDLLSETISRPDPELLNAVGNLQRHFASLSEDLQTLRIQRGSLLSGEGEPLDLAALLPPPGTGRPRLSIINTSALTEVAVLQFWVSRLLVELSRLGRKRPSATLQGVALFDEADTYVPATSSPPTKDPMFDLLRRSRSTGIGVLLATQNPGDFDYKARDNINTWLLGKITQDRATEKMRNVIGSYPDVGPRLASQRTGSFFLLTGTTKRELKADRSLMETVQLSEAEVTELARSTRPGAPRGRAGQ